jgi:1,4-alpha-glucan branching enzyme
MSLKKQLLKTKEICKVTFTLTSKEVENAESVTIVGEFNDWSETKTPLKKFKNGNFKITIDLEKGKQFQFKYLVDGEKWLNDSKADSYTSNDFSGENSVVITE